VRLKRIELAGFKSFVDPTRIELGDGITVVVGPNGCGKSNIIDAIRWVLGEHSARQLRGGVMDDLIFQGSSTRPQVSLCDVELTFSADRGQLPAPYHESNEISVRRRMTRESGSDAYINGKMVRLKDIIDLFLDTGVSSHAYAVVEQGSISRMISAKPEERRLILEEAAGIMKYRTRRRETERKMEGTRQNLERVIDLLEEVRSQCRSLKRQASRARRFKALQDEFEESRAMSMGMRYQNMQQDCALIEREHAEARRAEDQHNRQQAGMERELNDKRNDLIQYEAEVQAVQDAVRAAEIHQAEIQRTIEQVAGQRRLFVERQAHLEQRLAESRDHIGSLTEEQLRLEQQMDEAALTGLTDRCGQLQLAVASARERFQLLGEKRDQSLAEFERLKSEQFSLEQRNRHAASALNRLAERRQIIRERQDQLNRQAVETRQRFEHCSRMKAQAQQAFDHSERDQSERKTTVQASQELRAEAENKMNGSRSRIHQLAGELEEIAARLATDNIDNEVRKSLRDMGLKWVDEELQVPEGLELAVTAVLKGQSADAFCPDHVSSDLVGKLKQVIAGAPIAVFTGRAVEPDNSALASALDLDQSHPLYPLFSAVVMTDDIATAPEKLAKHPQCTAMVSRDGWLMGRDGWLVAPSRQHAAHKLELKRRLTGLEQELVTANRQATEAELAFEQAESALTQQKADWEEAHLARVEAQGMLAKSAADHERLQTELNDLETSRQHLISELAELSLEEGQIKEALSSGIEIDPESLAASERELKKVTDARQTAEQSLAGLRNDLAEVERELALYRQAQATIQNEAKRCQNEQKRRLDQIAEDEQQLSRIQSELASAEEQLDMDERLAGAAEQVNAAYAGLNEKRQAGHQLQQQVWNTEQELRKLQRCLNQAIANHQQVQLRLISEKTRLEDLAAEIQRQCHVDAEALVERLQTMEKVPDAEEVIKKARQFEDRLSRFGPVNLLAIDEYRQSAEREEFLSEQSADIEASLQTMGDTISRIDRTTKKRFQQAFEQTSALFRETFPRLFGGGRAELRLNSEDLLTAGVDIIAQPPGKRLQDIGLLSGGEKALTAVALVFSIFRMKPAPFCILDEVDAPLDEANVGRFGDLMRELSSDIQFINITHNKVSMQLADHLIGVSMPEPGVSRIVSVELDR